MWWQDRFSDRRDIAGHVLYREKYGDYRLHFYFFPRQEFLLRCIGGSSERTEYRLELIKRNQNGKVIGKFSQGNGFCSAKNKTEIVVNCAPFTKQIVIDLKDDSIESSEGKSHE